MVRQVALLAGVLVATAFPTSGNLGSRPEDVIENKINGLRRLYGPPGSDRWETQSIQCDLNGDGVPEVLVLLFTDEGLRGSDHVELADLQESVICNGFVLLTSLDGDAWPVFYAYDCYRMQLSLQWDDCLEFQQLVKSGGRDGIETMWGWDQMMNETEDYHPRTWSTSTRTWDAISEDYSNWQVWSTMYACWTDK